MTGRIHDNRLIFEAAIQKAALGLSPDARGALIDMLAEVERLAKGNAEESFSRAKWMMHAYWKVVAVYANHLRRLTRRINER